MKRVTVIGAGTMGHGIAQVSALAGYETMITDSNETTLNQAIRRIADNLEGGVQRGKVTREAAHAAANRVAMDAELDHAVEGSDLVIEAIVEDLDAKRSLFARVEKLAPNAILATNTSSLSIARIAEAVTHQGRVVGMHFFNPVHLMRLVEIVPHAGTEPSVVDSAAEVARRMGKEPIVVRDSPGFASSRLGVALGLEAMRMVEQGVAKPEDIDKAMELGYGHPMGPLRVTDVVGLDVRLAIAEYLHRELKDPRFSPPDILRRKVKAGELGKKTGKGFYEWPT